VTFVNWFFEVLLLTDLLDYLPHRDRYPMVIGDDQCLVHSLWSMFL